MSKIVAALHDPSFTDKPVRFQNAVFAAALVRGLIELRTAANGSVWMCDPSGSVYLGLV